MSRRRWENNTSMVLRKKDLRLWRRLGLVRIVSIVVLRRVNVSSGSIKGKKGATIGFFKVLFHGY
jgi:hypothetical protein